MFSLVSNGVVDAANNSVMNRGYARNAVQNITARNTEAGNYSYKYDTIDQLTNVMLEGVAPSTPSSLTTNEAFTYDPMGNRLSSARATGTLSVVEGYTPNSLNQYASLAYPGITNPLTYDQNGNILALPGGAGPTDPPSLSLVWDAQDRLAAVYNATNSNLIARYYYDPFGRRIKKATYSGGSSNVTYYLYADEGLIGEFDINGTELRSYEYLPGSLWMNDPVYMRTGGQTYYFLTDHLGAPQKLVNGNGAVVWSMTSEAFGETTVSPDSTVTNNLRFSSQYFDEETGLHYNTMRYYDTKLGRYLSRDPIGEDGGWNLYAFLRFAIVNAADVLGQVGSGYSIDPATGKMYRYRKNPNTGQWEKIVGGPTSPEPTAFDVNGLDWFFERGDKHFGPLALITEQLRNSEGMKAAKQKYCERQKDKKHLTWDQIGVDFGVKEFFSYEFWNGAIHFAGSYTAVFSPNTDGSVTILLKDQKTWKSFFRDIPKGIDALDPDRLDLYVFGSKAPALDWYNSSDRIWATSGERGGMFSFGGKMKVEYTWTERLECECLTTK